MPKTIAHVFNVALALALVDNSLAACDWDLLPVSLTSCALTNGGTVDIATSGLIPGSALIVSEEQKAIQSKLWLAFDVENKGEAYTFVKVTQTGDPPDLEFTVAHGEDSKAGGSGATFKLTFTQGNLVNAEVVGGGTGYVIGDVVTLRRSELESASGSGHVFFGAVTLTVGKESQSGCQHILFQQARKLMIERAHKEQRARGYPVVGGCTTQKDTTEYERAAAAIRQACKHETRTRNQVTNQGWAPCATTFCPRTDWIKDCAYARPTAADDDDGLSPGAIAGIVVGVAVVLGACGFLAWHKLMQPLKARKTLLSLGDGVNANP